MKNKIAGILILCLLCLEARGDSAWLAPEGGYKYTLSGSKADAASESLNSLKHILYRKFAAKQIILGGIRRDLEIKKASEIRQAMNGEIPDYYEKRRIKKNYELRFKEIDYKIDRAGRAAKESLGFTEKNSFFISCERGLKDCVSAGLSFFSQENVTIMDRSLAVFLKLKLSEGESFVLSFQKRILFSESKIKKTKSFPRAAEKGLFSEYSFLFGTSYEKKGRNFFKDYSLGAGFQAGRYDGAEYFFLSATHGIKFGNGITVTNFFKYTVREGAQYIYKKTSYDQISLGKEAKFGNKKIGAQIGYFWNKSLKKSLYRSSGPILTFLYEF